MSNTKPYLFGAVLGASAMYVALQYHVVHSHDGFQIVPRTPQHSVGLAYADVRNWSPSQWTDRPELARALMAHGSSDLISESVANSLADSVTEENSTLDQLRSFLDKSAKDGVAGEATGLLEIPTSSSSLKPAGPDSEADDDVLTRIPFPPEARKIDVADPFRTGQSQKSEAVALQSPPRSTGTSRFSAADVIDGLSDDASHAADSFSATAPRSDAPKAPPKPDSETAVALKPKTPELSKAIEDRIFANPDAAALPSKPDARDAGDSMFEEVSTQLESRAQAALNRAKEAVADKAGGLANGASKSSESYIRKQVEDATSDAARSVIKKSDAEGAKTPESLLEQFDPFLE